MGTNVTTKCSQTVSTLCMVGSMSREGTSQPPLLCIFHYTLCLWSSMNQSALIVLCTTFLWMKVSMVRYRDRGNATCWPVLRLTEWWREAFWELASMVEKPEGRSWQSIGKNLGSVTCTPLQTSLVLYNVLAVSNYSYSPSCHTVSYTCWYICTSPSFSAHHSPQYQY